MTIDIHDMSVTGVRDNRIARRDPVLTPPTLNAEHKVVILRTRVGGICGVALGLSPLGDNMCSPFHRVGSGVGVADVRFEIVLV